MRETTTGNLATALARHLCRDEREALRALLQKAVDDCNEGDKSGLEGADWQLLFDFEIEVARRL